MPQDLLIDYLELPGGDFDALEAFYSKLFHWQFTDFGPDYRAFSDGKMNGGFHQSTLQSRTDNGSTLIVLYSKNLEILQEQIINAKGSILREIFSFPGGRRFHFLDPHGNELAAWSDK